MLVLLWKGASVYHIKLKITGPVDLQSNTAQCVLKPNHLQPTVTKEIEIFMENISVYLMANLLRQALYLYYFIY